MQNSNRSFPRQGADSIRQIMGPYDFNADANQPPVPALQSIASPVNAQYYNAWSIYRGGYILSKFILPNRAWMFEGGTGLMTSQIKIDICYFFESVTLPTELVAFEVQLYQVRDGETLDFVSAAGTVLQQQCGANAWVMRRLEGSNLVLINPAGGTAIEDLIFILKITRKLLIDNFTGLIRVLNVMVEFPLI